jgi:hypothetical protein
LSKTSIPQLEVERTRIRYLNTAFPYINYFRSRPDPLRLLAGNFSIYFAPLSFNLEPGATEKIRCNAE